MPSPRLEPVTGDAVVLVNELVRLAVTQRASDIHLEPKHDMMHVRLRVDGALVDVQPISLAVAPVAGAVPARGARVHLRASTFPGSQGEKVVLRILSTQALIAFEQLGLEPS